jgi:hypothetical protein
MGPTQSRAPLRCARGCSTCIPSGYGDRSRSSNPALCSAGPAVARPRPIVPRRRASRDPAREPAGRPTIAPGVSLGWEDPGRILGSPARGGIKKRSGIRHSGFDQVPCSFQAGDPSCPRPSLPGLRRRRGWPSGPQRLTPAASFDRPAGSGMGFAAQACGYRWTHVLPEPLENNPPALKRRRVGGSSRRDQPERG